MKKILQLAIVLLVFSYNIAFSQSKFSVVGGAKFYNFLENRKNTGLPYYSRLGIFAGAAYDITEKNKIAVKTTMQLSKYSYFGTNIYEFGLHWRYAFVKRSKIDIFIENGIGIWHTRPFVTNNVPLSSSISYSLITPINITQPSSNTAIWTPALGVNYHLNKNISLALQYEHYIFLRDTYSRGRINPYTLNLSMEYNFYSNSQSPIYQFITN